MKFIVLMSLFILTVTGCATTKPAPWKNEERLPSSQPLAFEVSNVRPLKLQKVDVTIDVASCLGNFKKSNHSYGKSCHLDSDFFDNIVISNDHGVKVSTLVSVDKTFGENIADSYASPGYLVIVGEENLSDQKLIDNFLAAVAKKPSVDRKFILAGSVITFKDVVYYVGDKKK